MKLLFINALKGLKKKKIQMFGIIAMVMLSTAVYVGMNSAIDRLEDKYYDYLDEQNVEDFAFGVNIDYTKDVTKEDVDYLLENKLKNITDEEKMIMEGYKEFLESPTYNLQMIYSVKNILDKYDATSYLETRKIDALTEKHDFSYEQERSKTIQTVNKLLKIMPYSKDDKINIPYLKEGNFPQKSGEITILPGYAKTNNLKIGDKYKINDNEYKIVGFAYAPDYVYPLISFSMPIFDEKNNDIVMMFEEDYNNEMGVIDNSYALKYNYKTKRKFEITISNGEEKNKTETDPMFKIFEEEKDSIMMDMNTITRIARIGSLQVEFASDRLFAEYFLYLLLAISVLIIIVITKKRIDDERLQIGVLKSLGYNRFSIAVSYLVYPILGSIIGGILGYIIGLLVNGPIANILLSYYTVPLDNYSINLKYLKTAILIPMIVLSSLSYLIALIMLRKKPLELLKEGSNLKVNLFSKLVNKMTSLLPFNYRFKYSLAFRSLGKLIIVTLTSFCTGLLITLVLIGSNLFNNMIDESFKGIDYKYMVSLNSVDTNEITDDDKNDYILNVSMPLEKIVDKNGKEKKIKKENSDTKLSITGLDTTAKFVKVLDENDKNIITELDNDDSIIVNQNTKEILGLEIGDKLTLKYEDLTVEYTISGFNNEYMGYTGYASRESLSEKVGFEKTTYTLIYSNDKKYADVSKLDKEEASKIAMVLSVDDLKRNIDKQMDRFNGSIYIVIGFASVMALIIISVIANIVVEENKKTISLMKVMGYKNKRISSIVLNIYTPFIIVAYLLSIPVMKKILKLIVQALVGDIEVTIPIELSPTLAIIGLIGLLIAYYIAVNLSKRVLNKIPLAIALKRE